MTGNEGRQGAPLGQPWSVDTLADLHAGVLDDGAALRLRTEIAGDAEAQAVLAALEATTAELTAFGNLPAPRIPDSVAARIDAALARELGAPQQAPQQQLAPVVNLAERRKRRNRLAGWGLGVVAAAAAVAAVVGTVLPNTIGGTPSGNVAAPPAQQPGNPSTGQPLALAGSDSLNAAVAGQTVGRTDYGGLADPGARAGCLSANNAAGQQVIGARTVTVDGTSGVLFALTTGEKGTFRLLAVQASCAPGNPATLADKTVG